MNTIAVRHHPIARVASTVVSWFVAVIAVIGVDQLLSAISPAACAIAKMATIVAIAFAYMRVQHDEVTVDAALLTGLAWAALTIIAEAIENTHSGHSWFALLASPDQRILRSVLLLTWIAAPAMFARSASTV